MKGRLYRSRTNAMVGGVCAGLGQYLGIDPFLVRLFFVLLALGNGAGVLIYLILWIALPQDGQAEGATFEETRRAGGDEIGQKAREMADDLRRAVTQPNPQAALLIGAALVLLGVVFLLGNLNLPWLYWLDLDTLWPALLILCGGLLIWRRRKGA